MATPLCALIPEDPAARVEPAIDVEDCESAERSPQNRKSTLTPRPRASKNVLGGLAVDPELHTPSRRRNHLRLLA